MKLELQTGPYIYRTLWNRKDPMRAKGWLDFYAPMAGVARGETAFTIEAPLTRLSAPGKANFAEHSESWRVWDEGGEIVLQVWGGLIADWSLEARVKKDFKALALVPHAEHPQQNHMGFLLSTVLRWVTALRLVSEGGALIHGALLGRGDGTSALAATGPSGAGKTTLSSFFEKQAGFEVWTDETFMVLPRGGQWIAYGSPWPGMLEVAKNACAPLHALCFLEKASAHRLEGIGKRDAYLRLVPELFLPPWQGAQMDKALDNLYRLVEATPCQVLHFAKSPSVVDYVAKNLVVA